MSAPQDRGGPMLTAAKLWRRDGEAGDHTHSLLFAAAPQRGEGGR